MNTSDANKDVIAKFFQLLGTSDVEGLKSFMAEDLQWVVPQDPSLTPLAGARDKAGWEQLYRGFLSKMPGGVRYDVLGMTAEGDRVAVEAESYADTPRGPFHNRYHFLFRLRDGKILLSKEYADSLFMHSFTQPPTAQ